MSILSNTLRRGLFIPSCFFLLHACQQPPRHISPAFYHWKTQLALDPAETAYLDQLDCRKLYVKFLDIARDPAGGEIRPYSLLEVSDTGGLSGKTIVPCVFIANGVFQGISNEQLDWLAGKTRQAFASVGGQFPDTVFTEYQFDCDWTAATREPFFSFLKKIRRLLPPGARLSATIRLHQYKFPGQSGVPPVDRGMLMLYNTGDIDDPEETNSIFDPADAEKYLRGAPSRYPLPLDLALPVFSWALAYRDAALWKIIPEVDRVEIQSLKFKAAPKDAAAETTKGKVQASTYRVVQPTILGGHYLRPGDLLRLETVDTALLRQAARLSAGVSLAKNATVAFYHLDTAAVRRYPAAFLKAIWSMQESNSPFTF